MEYRKARSTVDGYSIKGTIWCGLKYFFNVSMAKFIKVMIEKERKLCKRKR